MDMNWQCPFCGRHTTITDERMSEGAHRIDLKTKHGRQALKSLAIACPNNDCQELYLVSSLGPYKYIGPGQVSDGKPHSSWQLRPQGRAKPLPEYVPAPIVQDYREACLIIDLSPKASATLARRCLQGMIRDFWKISKGRLVDEIEALEDKVDPATWVAIDAVRKLGNVGAHMEKDINMVVDVEPDEAALLVELIETLVEDWYVGRFTRDQRMRQVVEAAAAKKATK